MARPSQKELTDQLVRLVSVILGRRPLIAKLDRYYDGDYPLPPVVQGDPKVKRAYRMLMQLTNSNWPRLIVDTVEEGLEVQGVRFGDQDADDEVWDLWQENGLDAEQSMLHQSLLTDGRAYVIVWRDGNGDSRLTLEHASMCAVEYETDSKRRRKAAVRLFVEDDRWHATLYRPDNIWKYQAKDKGTSSQPDKDSWERRDVKGEKWPLANPLNEVPVVEFAVNRSLRPTPFGTARGEFEPNLDHIDRIHYKLFSGLVALTWSGFPLRALIGDPIAYQERVDSTGAPVLDDDGKAIEDPLPPFDPVVSSVIQIENKDGKLIQLPEANVENYSPEMDIKHLAALTGTPAHYLLGEMINLSADAIRAANERRNKKIRRHHRSIGESWEDVSRLMVRVRDIKDPRGSDQSAEVIWVDPESRSLAEEADAASKLASIGTPWRVIAQKILRMSPQEIRRADSESAGDVLRGRVVRLEERQGLGPVGD